MINEMFQNLNVQNSINAKAIGADLLAAIKQAVFDMEHPVGDVEEQRPGEPTPAQKYGMGTWTLDTTHEGRTEIGASTTYPLGSTGGSENHKHNSGDLYAQVTTYNQDMDLNLKSVSEWQSSYIGGGVFQNLSSATRTNIDGVPILGDTNSAPNMQPYLAVNYWKRVA